MVGIERAPGMLEALGSRGMPPSFRLVQADMLEADIPPGQADLVMAFGSLQYARDPDAALRRFAGWLRPGGVAAVYVDSLAALVTELLESGRHGEAMSMLRTRRGTLRAARSEATLRLFTASELVDSMTGAGLAHVSCRGLCVSAGFQTRDRIATSMAENEAAHLGFERELAEEPGFADHGLHLFGWGFRPMA